MQLTIQDVSKFFNVPERTIYRWIDHNAMPVYQVSEQYRFNKSELIEWASARRITVYPEFFSSEDEDLPLPDLADAIKAGGIFYDVEGETKETVLKNTVSFIKLPEDIDPDFIWQILLAREKLASTGVGDGIAIPHVRNPLILNIANPIVNLCFLKTPIDFGALDGKPVHVLFTLICPTPRVHLHLISRLAFVLKDDSFRKLLVECASAAQILGGISAVESKLCGIKGAEKGAQEK